MKPLLLGAAIAGTLLVASFAITIWFFDGEPNETASKWTAVYAIADWLTVGIALGGIGALLYLRRQVELAREQIRADTIPYLRIDLSPVTGTPGTWPIPSIDSRYTFDASDFDLGDDDPVPFFREWEDPEGIEVCLWVTNQQKHSIGVARGVGIEVTFEMSEFGDETNIAAFSVPIEFHYLEPERTVRYRLGRVSSRLGYLSGSVTKVAYGDIDGRPLSLAHGSVAFEWDGINLANIRGTMKSRGAE